MSREDRGPEKVLLCIDDSQVILEYERRIFEKSGYIFVTETSPRRGLELATKFCFDAILVDYQMPEMNGHEFAYEIRHIRTDALIVMVSGSDIPDETRQLVNAVLPKDEAVEKLIPTITRLCVHSSRP